MRKIIILLVVLLVSGCEPVFSDESNLPYIMGILRESRGEGSKGMLAVACGIRNRPEGLQGVDNRPINVRTDIHRDAVEAWRKSQDPKNCAFLKGADMWCSNIEQCQGSWLEVPMVFIVEIGRHRFYRRITEK